MTSVVGVGVFLTFLLVVVQVVLYLFTASIAQAAAVDGAGRGAGAATASPGRAAQEHATAVLGRLADGATITAVLRDDVSGQVLSVDVRVPLPSVLGSLGLASVQRGAEARIEQ